MIILLDTSTPLCKLTLIDTDLRVDTEWQADRELAKGLLKYLQDQLAVQGKTWTDLTGIGVFRGPGSFTGLRIGLTVLNTVADSQAVPINLDLFKTDRGFAIGSFIVCLLVTIIYVLLW